MAMSDEIERLAQLRERGVLTDDEFARAKARVLDAGSAPTPGVAAINAFRRSRADRWLGGVCGGLAQVTGIESWLWRLGFAVLFLFGGAGLLAYVLLWIFVPSE